MKIGCEPWDNCFAPTLIVLGMRNQLTGVPIKLQKFCTRSTGCADLGSEHAGL